MEVHPTKKTKNNRYQCPRCSALVPNPNKQLSKQNSSDEYRESPYQGASDVKNIQIGGGFKKSIQEGGVTTVLEPKTQFQTTVKAKAGLEELNIIQDAVNKGIAENPNDFIRQATQTMAKEHNLGGARNMQQNQEVNEKTPMEKIMDVNDRFIAQETQEAMLERMRQGKASKSELIDFMREQLETKTLMKMMKEQDGDSNNMMKDMMQMMMLQNMMPQKGNGESTQHINSLKEYMEKRLAEQAVNQQMQQMRSEFLQLLQTKKEGLTTDDVLKFMGDKQTITDNARIEVDKAKAEAAKEREQRIYDSIQTELKNLQAMAQQRGNTSELGKIKELLTMMDEINKMTGKKEVSTGEVILGTLSNVASQALPAVQELARAKQMEMQQRQMPQQPPEGYMSVEQIDPNSPAFQYLSPQDQQKVLKYQKNKSSQEGSWVAENGKLNKVGIVTPAQKSKNPMTHSALYDY
jgi:Arc/MetJ-type ribon-helix-helix transcriptional regulator